jgi:hypothetical protein
MVNSPREEECVNPQAVNPQAGPGPSVAEVVRAVVGTVAPEELAFFDDIAAAFFHDPVGMLSARKQPDRPTESGPTGLEGLITTIVLAAVTGVASDAIKQAVQKAIGAAVKHRPRFPSRRHESALAGETLLAEPVPSEEVQAIEQWLRDLAAKKGIPPQRVDEACASLRAALETGPGDGSAAA